MRFGKRRVNATFTVPDAAPLSGKFRSEKSKYEITGKDGEAVGPAATFRSSVIPMRNRKNTPVDCPEPSLPLMHR
jgi:hypothetical protein